MDLDPPGKHCSLPSCNVLDFLPIKCSCQQWFCKLHISPGLHDCGTSWDQHHDHGEPAVSSSSGVRSRCAFVGCDRLSLSSASAAAFDPSQNEGRDALPASCPGCQLSFCVYHRHQQSHSCSSISLVKEETAKHEAARAILAQNFPASVSTSHTPVVARRSVEIPTDPKKLQQLRKVELMKLRHKAVPGDPKDKSSNVTLDRRIHVNVRTQITGYSAREISLWFRKTTITGRVLDLISQHLSLSSAASASLRLERILEGVGEHATLENHRELSEQLEDGSTIILASS